MTTDNISSSRSFHKTRPSYLHSARHLNDYFLNLGYKYSGNILHKTTSKVLWTNPNQTGMFKQLETLIEYLVDNSKMVKKWFSIAHDKNTLNIN